MIHTQKYEINHFQNKNKKIMNCRIYFDRVTHISYDHFYMMCDYIYLHIINYIWLYRVFKSKEINFYLVITLIYFYDDETKKKIEEKTKNCNLNWPQF